VSVQKSFQRSKNIGSGKPRIDKTCVSEEHKRGRIRIWDNEIRPATWRKITPPCKLAPWEIAI
jgi:hypothetical protein